MQDRMLREHFSAVRPQEMPAGLSARIMESVRTSQKERFSLGSDKWGVVAAAVISALLIAVAIWMGVKFDLFPEVAGLDMKLTLPKIDLSGAGMWIMICGCALILLVGESLLWRHFVKKRDSAA